jgi:hypothetical protein
VPLGRLALMLNLDQVGRPLLDGSPLRRVLGIPGNAVGYVVSHRDAGSVRRRVDAAAAATGTRVIGIPEGLLQAAGFSSDSVSFGPHAPTLFLSTGAHADQHGAGDTARRLHLDQTARVVRLVLEVIRSRTNAALRP